MKINLIGHLVKVGKTKPNKPKVKIGKMNITSFITMNYEQRTMNDEKNKPKQTQFPQRDTQYAIRNTRYEIQTRLPHVSAPEFLLFTLFDVPNMIYAIRKNTLPIASIALFCRTRPIFLQNVLERKTEV